MSALTTEEAKWLNRLQTLLNECPSDRIGFYTVGDPWIGVYDRTKEKEIDKAHDENGGEFCGAVESLDAYFRGLNFPAAAHSTAG